MRLTLARLLHESGGAEAILALRRRAPVPLLTVLTYHRVADPKGAGTLDADVIDATPEQFERQVAFLAQKFRFIGVSDLHAFMHGAPLPPNPVLITFDDGYLECHTTVLPILRRHQAKATFFIATSYVEERKLFWWDFITQVVARSTVDRLMLDYPFPLAFDISGERRTATVALINVVKTHVGLELERFQEELLRAAGIQWSREDEAAVANSTLMSWEQVRDLAKNGMDVHSHTRTHRVLQTLSPAQLRRELEGSRAELEERLEAPVDALAYPVGYPLGHLSHVRAALRDSGYQLGFTNQTGVNHLWGRTDPYDLRRISMTTEYDEAVFRGLLALPHLAPLRRRMPAATPAHGSRVG